MNKELYQEHEGDSFEHDGVRHDINKIFRIAHEKKVSHVLVVELAWNLEQSKIMSDTGELVCGSCHTMKGDKIEHADRVAKSDLSQPIIILKADDGKLLSVDGVHRIEKALNTGAENLPVKIISKEEFDSCRI